MKVENQVLTDVFNCKQTCHPLRIPPLNPLVPVRFIVPERIRHESVCGLFNKEYQKTVYHHV